MQPPSTAFVDVTWSDLSVGDQVITATGITGTIISLQDDIQRVRFQLDNINHTYFFSLEELRALPHIHLIQTLKV